MGRMGIPVLVGGLLAGALFLGSARTEGQRVDPRACRAVRPAWFRGRGRWVRWFRAAISRCSRIRFRWFRRVRSRFRRILSRPRHLCCRSVLLASLTRRTLPLWSSFISPTGPWKRLLTRPGGFFLATEASIPLTALADFVCEPPPRSPSSKRPKPPMCGWCSKWSGCAPRSHGPRSR